MRWNAPTSLQIWAQKSSMWQRGRPKVGASENGAMCSYDAGKKMYAELYAFHSVNVNPFSVAMLLFNQHLTLL